MPNTDRIFQKVFSACAFCTVMVCLLLFSGCKPPLASEPSPTPVGQAPGSTSQEMGTRPTAITETDMSSATPSQPATAPTFSPPTWTPRPTLSPTWTPRPTLSPDSVRALITGLLSNNGGCRLPCWWGITPGRTTWQEARSFLETMSPEIIVLRDGAYGITYENLPLSLSDSGVGGATVHVDQGIVQTIRTAVYYPLEQVLQEYGKPNEIWVYADTQTINRYIPYTIALFYQDHGFLAVYEGTAEKEKRVEICPRRIDGIQSPWFLWNPALPVSFTEAGRTVLLFVDKPSEGPFRPLQDVSELDVDTFFNIYVSPENSDYCFETWID